MKHKQVFSMNLTGPIDYGFRNDYMFRAALQLSQKGSDRSHQFSAPSATIRN